MKHGVVIGQFHTQHMHVNACLPSEGHGVTECLAERGRGGGDAEVHATGSMMWQAREEEAEEEDRGVAASSLAPCWPPSLPLLLLYDIPSFSTFVT